MKPHEIAKLFCDWHYVSDRDKIERLLSAEISYFTRLGNDEDFRASEQGVRVAFYEGIERAEKICVLRMSSGASIGLAAFIDDWLDAGVLLKDAAIEFKRSYAMRAVVRSDNNRTHAARMLGIDARTMFRYLEAERGKPCNSEDGFTMYEEIKP